MKKAMKKITAAVVAAAALSTMAVPVMAADVYVNFICAGQISGKSVPAGSNVTAPAVPVCPGYTFCGFDKSLVNVTANTTYTAVYANNALGDAAINAMKASLPAPAVTATTVANPNAVAAPAVPMLDAAALQTQQAQAAALQAQQAQAAQAAALQAQQAQAAQAAALQAQQAQAAQAAALQAQQAQAAQAAVVPAPVGVPSWVVGLEGVSQAGAVEAYNYLKNTKGLDDASIQGNWGAFMHHYAGHGVVGW